MNTVSILIIIIFLCSCIDTLDKRLIQTRREVSADLKAGFKIFPDWVIIFDIVKFPAMVWLLIIDWKLALIFFVVLFVLAMADITPTIGTLLTLPIKRVDLDR